MVVRVLVPPPQVIIPLKYLACAAWPGILLPSEEEGHGTPRRFSNGLVNGGVQPLVHMPPIRLIGLGGAKSINFVPNPLFQNRPLMLSEPTNLGGFHAANLPMTTMSGAPSYASMAALPSSGALPNKETNGGNLFSSMQLALAQLSACPPAQSPSCLQMQGSPPILYFSETEGFNLWNLGRPFSPSHSIDFVREASPQPQSNNKPTSPCLHLRGRS
ncbi:hypothetical protein GOP47_0028078 [Adiantum capillus-veneris]|nr:hypothetical protein GOP47_0028078 [Adiantum capillus-veneris]